MSKYIKTSTAKGISFFGCLISFGIGAVGGSCLVMLGEILDFTNPGLWVYALSGFSVYFFSQHLAKEINKNSEPEFDFDNKEDKSSNP